MKKIGTCPICNKGKLLEFEDKFQCNFMHSDQNFCNFFIYKSYSGKNLSLEMVLDLILHHQTKFYCDFINESGEKFEAALKISNGFIVFKFKDQILGNCRCVNCNGEIYRTVKGFGCENYFLKRCGMFVYSSYNGVILTEEHVRHLVSGENTPFISNFLSNSGTYFSAKLYVDDSDFRVLFDYKIGDCPKCKFGSIMKMEKFYGCSNFLSDIKCDFIIWPSIFGYEISFLDVEIILSGDSTESKSFQWNSKSFEGCLSLDESLKLRVI